MVQGKHYNWCHGIALGHNSILYVMLTYTSSDRTCWASAWILRYDVKTAFRGLRFPGFTIYNSEEVGGGLFIAGEMVLS